MEWRHDPRGSIAGIYVETADLGEMIAARYRLPAGADPADYYRGFPGQACPCEHWCYLVSGKLRYRLADGGSPLFQGGDAFHLEPGHLAEVLDDSVLIEFTRQDEYQRKLAHLSHADMHRLPEPALGPLASPRPGFRPGGPNRAA